MSYDNGGIRLTLSEELALSKARHLLNTIAGERVLSPQFGVPLEVLYNVPIPEILVERLQINFNQLLGIKTKISIVSYKEGKLTLKVELSTGDSFTSTVNV